MTVKAVVAGGLGRMGSAVIRAAKGQDGLQVVAAFDRPGWSDQAAEGVRLCDRHAALEMADVVVDFTAPEASVALAEAAAERGAPALVIGSTGLTAEQEDAIRRAAERVAIVRSGNFSLGVNVLLGLAEQAARILGPEDWDAEIFEAHHRRKADAPSGTALMLGEAVARGRGVPLADVRDSGRDGITGARAEGAIGFSVLRGGGIVGEHSVSFVAEDEILTFSHSARDRSLFARGALQAARWVAGRPAGLYDMQDVLGFRG